MKLKTESVDFEVHVSELVETWLKLMFNKQYEEADLLCTNFITNYGSAFKQRVFEVDDNEYNKLLILLILIKGLHDSVQICQATSNGRWHEHNSIVEQVWIKLCDCKERLEFASRFYQGEVIRKVAQSLDGLESFFQRAFGNGMYLSPGIIVDKYLCNICHKDSRACSHVAGRLYGGRICSYQSVNPQVNHVALVRVPKDLRCRIWSWHIQDNDEGEGITLKAPVLTPFSIDDFLLKID